MAEEKKYTETEYRTNVLKIVDMCYQVKDKYEQGNTTIHQSHELRRFIADAKQAVSLELRNEKFKKYLKGLEEKLKQMQLS